MLSSSSSSEEITNSSSTTITSITNNTSKTTTKSRSDYLSKSSSKSSFSSIPRTMEEVWKDINLSSLHDMNISISSSDPGTNPSTSFPIINRSSIHHQNNFQDFLARPFGNNNTNDPNLAKTMVVSSMASPPSSLHHSATALSLNFGHDHQFRFLDHNPLNHHHQNRHLNHNHHHDQIPSRPTSMMINSNNNSNVSSCFTNVNNSPFESPLHSSGKKRFPCENNGGGSGDNRRHKRMIKNRESAARSRARKQERNAYTNELELEVAHLMEENQRLRKQQEQFYQAAAAQLPKKHSLQRTSTAPF